MLPGVKVEGSSDACEDFGVPSPVVDPEGRLAFGPVPGVAFEVARDLGVTEDERDDPFSVVCEAGRDAGNTGVIFTVSRGVSRAETEEAFAGAELAAEGAAFADADVPT